MAGCSKLGGGSSLDFLESLQELHLNSIGSVEFRFFFDQLVSGFLRQICGSHCYRPLPPMLGDGQSVDLLKLYLSVREKGGYESVSANGLWGSVAEDSGFDSSASAGLKLVYVKYLDLLEKWFEKLVKNKDSEKGFSYMDLESSSKGGFLHISDEKKSENVHMAGKSGQLDFNGVAKICKSNEAESCVESEGWKESANGKEDGTDFESSVVVEEDESSRKRKLECHLAMLDWVQKVAKDPCDPGIGSLPERCKWKSYGNEHLWKQVLLARQAMLSKPIVDANAEQSIWQKKLKMHPTMYVSKNEQSTSRCSQRLVSVKESQAFLPSRKSQARDCSQSSCTGAQSDMEVQSDDVDSIWGNNYKRKRIPLGPFFQAKVPEWTGEIYEIDKRWLGTPVWPLEKTEHVKNLIERERVGKGRQDSCGCQFPGSIECVKYHVSEKRTRLKLELGSAFTKWKFDNMGDGVALLWTREDEKKFQFIVKSNPASTVKCFWNEICKVFRRKDREVLVSYYFNVYLLRRRADQNRTNPSNIDSDDDELENVGREVFKPPGSILCSPKKVHLNFR